MMIGSIVRNTLAARKADTGAELKASYSTYSLILAASRILRSRIGKGCNLASLRYRMALKNSFQCPTAYHRPTVSRMGFDNGYMKRVVKILVEALSISEITTMPGGISGETWAVLSGAPRFGLG